LRAEFLLAGVSSLATFGVSASERLADRSSRPSPAREKGASLRAQDRHLVRACLAGDADAWEALLRRYRWLLYAVPLRCGLSETDAGDVLHATCVHLLEHLEQLRNQRSLAAWLIKTAKRESCRLIRQRQGQPIASGFAREGSPGSALEWETAADPLPPDAVRHLEEEQMVRLAMEELSEPCRRLLELIYHTHPVPPDAEIARQLDIPEGSVRAAQARCLQNFWSILQEMGF
jgi:RNA polymerase sigma factor (sigma-70 family)